MGRVVDRSGVPLPNAGVSLKAMRKGAVTDSTGAYRIANIPAGTYTLVVRLMGHGTTERRRIRIVANRIVVADFQLTPKHIRLLETTVVGTRPPTKPRIERPYTPEQDSLALFGGWEFMKAFGGYAMGRGEYKGWTGRIYFLEDGSYEVREGEYGRDSTLCSGTFTIHRCRARMDYGLEATLWFEEIGCDSYFLVRTCLVHFATRDSIVTYPGGRNIYVADAGYLVYRRITKPGQH